jgi:hypothetical protein
MLLSSVSSSCLHRIAAAAAPGPRRCRAFSSSSSSSAVPPLPVVYHPLFSAPQLAPGHRFPMQVFRVIYERLLSQGIIVPSQVCTWV